MKIIQLTGMARPANSLNCDQENLGLCPNQFEWDHSPRCGEVKVYLDHTIPLAEVEACPNPIGMLFEPYELRPWHYSNAVQFSHNFKMILTHNAEYAALGPPFAFFPAGGSFIREHGMFPKEHLLSLIPGYKTLTSGHRLRLKLAYLLRGRAHIYQYGFASKATALRPYRFSIVVENSRVNYWFTEKLLDCISQGTVPIYWGPPDIGRFFDDRGILSFSSVESLEDILKELSISLYLKLLPALRANLEAAKEYYLAENWLSKHYPEYFG